MLEMFDPCLVGSKR